MTQDSSAQKPNWQAFAEEALDLWQTQLASTAADPKAREELARYVTPFSQMFADWSAAMQQAQKQAPYAAGDTTGFPAGSGFGFGAGFPNPAAPTDPAAAGSTDEPAASGTDVSGADGGRDHAPVDLAAAEGQSDQGCGTGSTSPTGAADIRAVATGRDGGSASFASQAGGSPACSSGDGDVAQLAGRLASLEQKMDLLLNRMSEFEKFEQRVQRATMLGPRSAGRTTGQGQASGRKTGDDEA